MAAEKTEEEKGFPKMAEDLLNGLLDEKTTTALAIGGAAFIAAIFIIRWFAYSLTPKSYDDALKELQQGLNNKSKNSSNKSSNKSGKNKSENKKTTEQPSAIRKISTKNKQRSENNLRNDHVIFADECPPEDLHSPILDNRDDDVVALEDSVEGILHNRGEDPNVNADIDKDIEVVDAFDKIQPLDEFGLEVRRKSLQTTPSASTRGSRTDLNRIGLENDEDELEDGELPPTPIKPTQQQVNNNNNMNTNNATPTKKTPQKSSPKKITIKADNKKADIEEIPTENIEQNFNVKKICKLLKRIGMAPDEICQVVEILMKKEEESSWTQTGKSSAKGENASTTLGQLRRENEQNLSQLKESQDLADSLATKLKNLRSDFAEERAALNREKNEMKAKSELQSREIESLKSRMKEKEDKIKSENESNDLERMKREVEADKCENTRLNEVILKQKVILTEALKKLHPEMKFTQVDYLATETERQKLLQDFIANSVRVKVEPQES